MIRPRPGTALQGGALAVHVAAALLGPVLHGGVLAWAAAAALLPAAVGPWLDGVSLRIRGGLVGLAGLGVLGPWVPFEPRDWVGRALVVMLAWTRLGPQGPGAERLAVLVGTLLMVSAAMGEPSVLFGLVWLLWTLTLPVALWQPLDGGVRRRETRRARRGLVVLMGGLTVGTFLALPRWPDAGPAEPPPSTTGLDDAVELGDFARLDDDPSVVATVRFLDGIPEPLRLRAGVLEAFDGRVWRNVAPRRPTPRLDGGPGRRLEVRHGEASGAVLLPRGVVAVESGGEALVQDVLGAWRRDDALDTEVVVRVGDGGPTGEPRLSARRREAALALPDDLDLRVVSLGRRLGSDGPEAFVARLREHFAGGFVYRRTAVQGGEDPMATFLFDTRAGHCEYFASAVVVLARAADLPARVVTGLAGGVPTDDGWVFRGTDAHAWAEVFVAGTGWVEVDATTFVSAPGLDRSGAVAPSTQLPAPPPPAAEPLSAWAGRAWARALQGYDHTAQRRLLAGALRGSLVLAPLALGLWWWRRRSRSTKGAGPGRAGPPGPPEPPDPVAESWARAVAALDAQGWGLPASLPPVALAQWVAARTPCDGTPLVRLAWLHYEVRYGGADGASRVEEARRLAGIVEDWDPLPSA